MSGLAGQEPKRRGFESFSERDGLRSRIEYHAAVETRSQLFA